MKDKQNFKPGDRVKRIDSYGSLVIERIDADGKKAKVIPCVNLVGTNQPRSQWVAIGDLRLATETSHVYILGDKVTHHDLFPNGYFTVVGVRANELELKGDFSGGACGYDQTDWVTIDKISPYKPEHFVRPPRGLLDRKYIDEQRQQDINDAIKRYMEAGRTVPGEWLEEYNEIVARKGARQLQQDIDALER
ncbi:hypothetical protein [Fibrella forsythiae]|uniref:Hint domain-containing protein n=1 Tax=Fibrella forsythiae TaxID=2817061 RepID=A0ABS3JBD9_9BACT|nr:hypothetical protein [Fibrella forsythiae]MBO0947299.1 hypothetical protein [Fibrella forsythiae]